MGVRRRLTNVNPHLRQAVERQARFLYVHDRHAYHDFCAAAFGSLKVHTAAAEKGRAYANVVKDVLRNLDLL